MLSTCPDNVSAPEFTTMTFDPRRPFNDLPDLPPARETETREVLRRCIAARVALAELRVSGKLIANQALLINSIPLLEAQASSEIENIVTTRDRLFRYANRITHQTDSATRETLRYRAALNRGLEMLERRPVSTTVAVEVCRTIKGVDLDIRNTPGTALTNEATGEIVYTPPQGEDVIRVKLANWERYLHESEEVDPLIRLAVMHYQFEAIHPFIDGNGRTGRVLNLLYLVDKGLLDIPVLYLSRHIILNKAQYYGLLRDVTARQAWEPWILFILEAIRTTAEWTSAKIHAIRELLDATAAAMRLNMPKRYSRELVELIFVNPYCRISDVVDAGIARRQTAAVYLKALATQGFLEEIRVGRENLYLNPPLLALLATNTGPS